MSAVSRTFKRFAAEGLVLIGCPELAKNLIVDIAVERLEDYVDDQIRLHDQGRFQNISHKDFNLTAVTACYRIVSDSTRELIEDRVANIGQKAQKWGLNVSCQVIDGEYSSGMIHFSPETRPARVQMEICPS